MEGYAHGFDWDAANTKKCQQHGVSIAEVEFLFRNAPTVYPDIKHSHGERRHLVIGRNEAGRYIFAAFTYRKRGEARVIRPISARYMHRREIKYYESL